MASRFKAVELKEIADVNPRLSESLPDDTSVCFVPMSAVSELGTALTAEMRPYSTVKKGYTPFLDGDLLVAKITPCFENGKIAQARLERRFGFGSTEFHVIRPHVGKADARYVLHFLRQEWIRREGERRMTGSGGQRRVPAHFLSALRIPLPPLSEQRRIAAVLDRAEALRAKRREALAQLDTLTQSIFLDLFGDPVANPKGWLTVTLADAVIGKSGIKAGPFGSSLKKEEYTASGYRVYGQEQVIAGRLDVGGYYIDECKYRQLEACAVAPGDLLISLVGSFGKVLVVPPEAEAGIINPRLLKIRPDTTKLLPEFLAELLAFPSIQACLAQMAHGGTMGILNAGILKQLVIILPPIALQARFLNQVSAVKRLGAANLASLRELEALFASLQDRAFKGALWDEPIQLPTARMA